MKLLNYVLVFQIAKSSQSHTHLLLFARCSELQHVS